MRSSFPSNVANPIRSFGLRPLQYAQEKYAQVIVQFFFSNRPLNFFRASSMEKCSPLISLALVLLSWLALMLHGSSSRVHLIMFDRSLFLPDIRRR